MVQVFRLTKEEHKQAARSLQSNPAFHKIIEVLAEERDISIKGLMTARPESVGQLQGRSQLLVELLEALQYNY